MPAIASSSLDHGHRVSGIWTAGGTGVVNVIACAASILVLSAFAPAAAQSVTGLTEYSGLCDASAAAPIGAGVFVVAGDEDNVLRIYRHGQPKATEVPLDPFLKPDPNEPEADLEGAARSGNLIYWVTSHSQNKNGKDRSSRHRLFATEIVTANGLTKLEPVGTPYLDLRADLIAAPQLATFKLADAAKLAPEAEGGFNIEGLAMTPEGQLLVGFRNPVVGGKALVAVIENPRDVMAGQKAKIGPAITLPLNKRGIRSIDYDPTRKQYLLVAGPTADKGSFALYTWSGPGDGKPRALKVKFGKLKPEAVFLDPDDSSLLHVLSDDGDRQIKGEDCKALAPSDQRFRGGTVKLP